MTNERFAEIHSSLKSESVSGVIIGGSYTQAVLMYEDREQCQVFYANDDIEISRIASERLSAIIEDSGKAFESIYPEESWRIKVIQ